MASRDGSVNTHQESVMNLLTPPSAWSLFACLALAGCYDDDFLADSTGPVGLPVDLTGEWIGTWTSSTGATGEFLAQFNQSGTVFGGGAPTSISGTSSLADFGCPAALVADLSVSPGGFTSATSLSGSLSDGALAIQMSAFVSVPDFGSFVGTYEVLPGSPCAGETGTLSASIVEPLPVAEPPPEVEYVVLLDDLGRVEIVQVLRHSEPQMR